MPTRNAFFALTCTAVLLLALIWPWITSLQVLCFLSDVRCKLCDCHPASNTPMDDAFLTSMRKLADLVPDDHTRVKLLSPSQETGAARLHEFGQRVRVYTRYLDAWKGLHISQAGAHLTLRDDVPARLRNYGLTSDEQTRLLGDYDHLRFFLSHFSHALFPWLHPYFATPLHFLAHSSRDRGIVFTASDVYILPLIMTIKSLRWLGCQLPIEVLHFGDEDLSPASKRRLVELTGVVVRDMSFMLGSGLELAGWGLKPFALLLSSFQEVILMDADAFVFRDPTCLFSEPGYEETGALYFHDRRLRSRTGRDLRAWLRGILPEPLSENLQRNRLWTGASTQMQESGLVLVDKSRHLVSLLVACHLNGVEVGNEALWGTVHGDKETYWLAQEMAGDHRYAFHEGGLAIVSQRDPEHDVHLQALDGNRSECAKQLLHLDKAGRPLWFNGGLYAFDPKSEDEEANLMHADFYVLEEVDEATGFPEWRRHELPMYWCLSAGSRKEFTDEEKATMEFLREAAREVKM